MIKESDVLERIAMRIDDMDMDELAELHNNLYSIEEESKITGDAIVPQEGWHLVPKEGAH